MAINYKVLKCKNPNGADGAIYASCRAVKTSDYDFDQLSEDIAFATTVTKADAMAVLASIKPFIKKALLSGQRVVLNDLGSFVVGIRSKCFAQAAIAEEDFLPSNFIKGHKIHFRAEPKLKREIAGELSLKRISSDMMA